MADGMVLCVCMQCIKKFCTDEHGKEVDGQFVHPSTQRKHLQQHYEDPDKFISKLAEDFAKLKVPDDEEIDYPSSESADTIESTHDVSLAELIYLVTYFVAWLYLACGMTRANCRVARDYLVQIAHAASRTQIINGWTSSIAKDVRTITKRMDLEATIERYVCCPKCFSLYEVELAPDECGYREFANSEPCGRDLFASHSIPEIPTIIPQNQKPPRRNQKPKLKKPVSTFVLQDFKAWLTWFLSHPDTENNIEKWDEECKSDSSGVKDYIQSPAFRALYEGFGATDATDSSHLLLSFSLFIDWFNPLGNKISGRQVSIGIFALHCLNLPPQARHLIRNTYLAAVVPAPNQPDMTTTTHVLCPLCDLLLELNRGITIPTHKYPEGRKVNVRLTILVGDMVANHKVAGFTSHSGTYFCGWCTCRQTDLHKMNVGRKRTRRDVIDASYKWKQCDNTDGRADWVIKTGVRWSELNRLPYWDPVKNVGLGIMHNWFEGVLANHFRGRWKFSIKKQLDAKALEKVTGEIDLEALDEGEGWLSPDVIHVILKNLGDVKVPLGVTRIPKGLGTAANGKLKASEWHALFAIHLPLAAVDVFLGNYDAYINNQANPTLFNLLDNFSALVECTHIVASRKVKEGDSTRYKVAYYKYTVTSENIQFGVKIKPNHHYAIHMGSQMDWWGPMLGVAEFAGERLCGFLQKINTNSKMEEMAQTIMKRFCHLQRLLARAPPEEKLQSKISHRNVGPAFEVDKATYDLLFDYYHTQDDNWLDFRRPPYPDGAKVLGPFVHEVMGLEGRNGRRYSKTSPNNIVKVEVNGRLSWAKVLHILKLDEPDDMVVMVQGFIEVDDEKLSLAFKSLGLIRVVNDSRKQFIAAASVLTNASHRMLPAWSMGLNTPSMLIVDVDSGGEPANPSFMRDMDEIYAHTHEVDNDAMEIDTDPSMT